MFKRRHLQYSTPTVSVVTDRMPDRTVTGFVGVQLAASLRVLGLPELLGRIISYTILEPDTAIGERDIKESKIPTHATYPPWPMMLVCKLWFDVVKSTPELWTTFVAIFHGCTVTEMMHVPRMFDAHLQFSKGRALTLCFYLATERWAYLDSLKSAPLHSCYASSPTQMMSILLEKARSHQHRWYKFSVRVDSLQTSNPPLWLMEIVNDAVRSQLKHLNTGVYLDTIGPSHQPRPYLGLRPYHGLETLQVTGPFKVSLENDEKRFSPPFFPGLRVLRFECHDADSIQTLWRIFRESPSLQEVHLDVEHGLHTFLPAISLPSVVHIRISARVFEVGMHILAWMTLSSLTWLEISNLPLYENCLQRLAHVLHSMNTLLKRCSLHIYHPGLPISSDALKEVLDSRSMVQLEHLELAWIKSNPARSLPSSVHHALASILRLRKERCTCLPYLTQLSIDTDIHDALANPSSKSVTHLRKFVEACRKKFRDAQRFQCVFTSSMAVSEEETEKFKGILMGNGKGKAADNFEVVVESK